jgi:hypothetical protein
MKTRRISKRNWIILLTVISFGLLCVFVLLLTNQPVKPQISILKMQPCLQENNEYKYVNDFKVDDLKYICAEVETDSARFFL